MNSTERIQLLASTFPTLADRPEVVDWDAEALDDWSAVASGGEKHAVRFVLGVWNQYAEWKCGPFDVIHAMGVWDENHRRAFADWANDPYTL